VRVSQARQLGHTFEQTRRISFDRAHDCRTIPPASILFASTNPKPT
jgi:hypothetical protein